MRRTLLLLAVGACATPAAPVGRAALPLPPVTERCEGPPEVPRPASIDAVATDAALAGAALPVRAHLAYVRRYAWTRDGLDGPKGAPVVERVSQELAVAAADPSAVRVRIEDSRVRALVWFRRSDLALTVVHRVTLALAPTASPDPRAGVTVLPGADIRVTGSVCGRRRVEPTLLSVAFSGWLAAADVGDLFVARPEPPAHVDARVPIGTAVLASPSGPTVARLSRGPGVVSDGWVDVSTRAGAPPGFVALRYATGERVIVLGLVDARAVTRIAPGIAGRGEAGAIRVGGFITGTTRATIPQGTSLYDPAGVEQVGVALKDLVGFGVDDSRAPTCSLRVLFPVLGFEAVTVRCSALRR